MISLKSLTMSLNNSFVKVSFKVITIVTSIPEHMPSVWKHTALDRSAR